MSKLVWSRSVIVSHRCIKELLKVSSSYRILLKPGVVLDNLNSMLKMTHPSVTQSRLTTDYIKQCHQLIEHLNVHFLIHVSSPNCLQKVGFFF